MKVVQIGLGGWGKNHTRILKQMNVLSAVCDIDSKIVSRYSHDYGIPGYEHIKDLLKYEKFDIAVVTTPTNTHYNLASNLLDNGKHVFVEKPFTQTISQGHALISLAKNKNLKMTCGYIERFNPVTQFVAEQRPTLLEFHRESCFPDHIANDTGIVLDTMVHDIDTACWIFGGYPETIKSTIQCRNGINEDLAITTLGFRNGIANIVSNWNTAIKMRTIHATYPDMIVRGDFVKREIKKTTPDNRTEIIEYPNANPLEMELYHFIKCVEDNVQPDVTPEHANRITEIAYEILGKKENVRLVH